MGAPSSSRRKDNEAAPPSPGAGFRKGPCAWVPLLRQTPPPPHCPFFCFHCWSLDHSWVWESGIPCSVKAILPSESQFPAPHTQLPSLWRRFDNVHITILKCSLPIHTSKRINEILSLQNEGETRKPFKIKYVVPHFKYARTPTSRVITAVSCLLSCTQLLKMW